MPGLADAARARRVALVTGRARYERALQSAAAAAAISERAANVAWFAARERARVQAAARRALWERHHVMATDDLIRARRSNRFTLESPGLALFRNPAMREAATWHIRMITTELRHRGAEVT